MGLPSELNRTAGRKYAVCVIYGRGSRHGVFDARVRRQTFAFNIPHS